MGHLDTFQKSAPTSTLICILSAGGSEQCALFIFPLYVKPKVLSKLVDSWTLWPHWARSSFQFDCQAPKSPCVTRSLLSTFSLGGSDQCPLFILPSVVKFNGHSESLKLSRKERATFASNFSKNRKDIDFSVSRFPVFSVGERAMYHFPITIGRYIQS